MHSQRTSSIRRRIDPHASEPQRGVTLFELLVTIMVIAILAAVGVPTYRYVTTSSRLSSEMNALMGDLQFARSEAVREGVPVTVCIAGSITSPYSCAGTGATSWQKGWIVFTDLNENQTIDSGDSVLRVHAPFTQGDTFTADNNVGSITFNREGFAYTGVSKVTLVLDDSSANPVYAHCLYISESGMMSTAMHSTDSSCQ